MPTAATSPPSFFTISQPSFTTSPTRAARPPALKANSPGLDELFVRPRHSLLERPVSAHLEHRVDTEGGGGLSRLLRWLQLVDGVAGP